MRKHDNKDKYYEDLTNWVLQFGEDPKPSHSQFSAYEVAQMIMKFNEDKLSGKIKF